MRQDLIRYSDEIFEFLTSDTLRAIDWGVLDLGHIKDLELKTILMVFEKSLTLELMDNYKNNSTGIFRVRCYGKIWCYEEYGCCIKAENLEELKKLVIGQNRIWYVFDEFSLNCGRK